MAYKIYPNCPHKYPVVACYGQTLCEKKGKVNIVTLLLTFTSEEVQPIWLIFVFCLVDMVVC